MNSAFLVKKPVLLQNFLYWMYLPDQTCKTCISCKILSLAYWWLDSFCLNLFSNLSSFFSSLCVKCLTHNSVSHAIWHYREANTDLIKKAISNINWKKLSITLMLPRKFLYIFNEAILNVFSNQIPHETLTCDDKDLGLNLFYRINTSHTRTFEGVTLTLSYLIN